MDRLLPLLHASLARYAEGRLADAEALLRLALSLSPAQPDGLRLVGLCAGRLGRHREALRLIGRAVRMRAGQHESYLESLSVALSNIAVLQGREGDAATAAETCRTALALAPDHRDALANLAMLLRLQGRTMEAAQTWRRVTILAPEHGDAWREWGRTLVTLSRPGDAEPVLRRAAALLPADPDVQLLFGNTTLPTLNHRRIVEFYARSYRLVPDHGSASNLALALLYQGRTEEGTAAAHRSAALRPDLAEVWMNVSSVVGHAGDSEAATHLNRRVLTLRPTHVKGFSNLLMVLQYLDIPPLELAAENRRFDALFGRPRAAHHARHENTPDPERTLRVGYVSSDFRQHVASCFFEPLLAGHDPRRVLSVCYSDTPAPDAVTRRLIALSGAWRETGALNERELDALIRADGIDILVDLAGHSSGNRLTVFARRPAPVTATWLGYPDTTGLSTVDYRLVDAITDPPGPADALASETLFRLSSSFLCYRPPSGAPDPGPSPAASGVVTFGSFNRLAKVTPKAVALWAAVLNRTPGSRLLMKSLGLDDPTIRARVENMFRANGVCSERLELVSWSPTWLAHLELYQRIDIALDTFPYNGTTTSCEAFWMGVPMIGLLGDRHAARVGASLLTRIGLPDLLARTPEEYVAIAARLAADRERLATLRAGMRDRLRASPLCDATGFARQMENAYRTMWGLWCEERRG